MPTSQPVLRRFLALAAAFGFGLAAFAADESSLKDFNLPSDSAATTLKLFSEQSGVQVLFPTDGVSDVVTNAVHGRLTPLAALGQMVAGTPLTVVRDDTTGALGVRREPPTGPEKNGQSRPQPSPTTGTEGPAAGQPAGEGTGRSSGDVVQLNPFEVQADSDTSYGALNSHSITQFNTALDHLPVSADIFDQTFIKDVGATTVEGMIQSYDAGAQIGAPTGGTTTYFQNGPGDQVGNSSMKLRGQTTQTMQMNSLLMAGHGGNTGGSFGPTSNFDLERVEIISGPQAMLYAGGGAGGVINLVTKEARIGQPTFGSVQFRMDEFGSKYVTSDFGASQGNFAVRVATVNSSNDSSRMNIGDDLDGLYLQFAAKLGNTTLRLSLQQTTDEQVNSTYVTITAPSGHPLNRFSGDSLGYILATNQGAAVDNGNINWNNLASFGGDWKSLTRVDEFATLEANTQWTSWFSTQASVAYSNDNVTNFGAATTFNLYSPTASTNPLPGNWAVGGSPPEGYIQPNRNKAARVSALITNELFGGRVKSQTIFGTDYIGSHGAKFQYSYYQADSNGNPIENPALVSASNPGGRTIMANQAWAVNNGPVLYPLFRPNTPMISWQGVNYVRANLDPVSASLVGVGNPLGTTITTGGSTDQVTAAINDGLYGMNYMQWLDGKLDTLLGVRYERSTQYLVQEGQIPPSLGTLSPGKTNAFNFSFGTDYHLRPWLAPYVELSDSVAPPADSFGVAGPISATSEAIGEEAGLKLNSSDGRFSGSLALYHVNDKNNFFMLTSSLGKDINPSGLNGTNGVYANGFEANARSDGAQLTATANPVKNWRIRLSAALTDGTYLSTVGYPQEYNDQFHENSSGQVTFADGTVVYVPATFNSKQLTVPSTTVGATPLTVTALSTPGNPYYATPFAVSGQITGSSPGGQVLKSTDPVHGAILTGVTGLPISDYQLNPALAGITIPGFIYLAQKGQSTFGYPEFSANLTNLYEFSDGWAKGFRIGGTVSAGWKNRGYNYYYQGFTGPTSPSQLFFLPTQSRIDLIAGYSRKFRSVTWSTQLNVYNLFNHYHVIIYPYPVTAFATASNIQANFDQQPRSYVWTNTISF